jgi:ribosome maturation factor RimP
MDNRLNRIRELVETRCNEEEFASYFFVSCNYHEEQHKLEVFIDGDEGISLGVLSGFTRFLRNEIELDDLYDEELSLEVSSPGIGSPLFSERQYKANIGRNLKLTLKDGEQVSGKLVQLSVDSILLEIETRHKPGAKAKLDSREISRSDVGEAKAIVSFKK